MNDLANSTMTQNSPPVRIDFNTPELQRKRRLRAFKDRLTRWYVLVGGLAVLAAITLIFFYLAYVVVPLFQGAELTTKKAMTPAWLTQDAGKPLMIALEEQNLVGMRVSDKGQALFFDTKTGAELKRVDLPVPAGTQVTSIGADQPGNPLVVLGLSNGQALVFSHSYKITYPDNHKTITPAIDYPYGQQPFALGDSGRALEHVSLNVNGDTLVVAGSSGAQLQVLQLSREENMMTGEVTSEQNHIELPQMTEAVKAIFIDPRQQWLYVINGRAQADVFSLRDKSLNGRYKLLDDADAEVTASAQLVGGISLIIGDSKGGLAQWFMARDPDGEQRFKQIRTFQMGKAPIVQIDAEERRKGFVALDASGKLGVFHSTAHRTLLVEPMAEGAGVLALSPRANRLFVEEGGKLIPASLRNPHPEVSWSALWSKVWYENYDEPKYVWQSTASNTDFEPKLSLSPLTFGTLKAAFYAMILAAPLAIAAAIYTAYFMAPGMRRKVKPVIELMEAMPTVILGFFAGLFLAPYLEGHLPGVFSLFVVMPFGILLAGFIWSRLPESIRLRVPDGWEAAILIPVILFTGWGALTLSPFLETWFFGGDMRLWITNDLGITYDQRNALVVGIAMGFAVIPNIYSIAEDAVFSVPRSLTLGSLALGATPWQTLTRVVILTASPGIFSALMIGMGRAVGETMIVLMATGNTPVMEMNLFEGMRTLAANVAVEMPESEVGGSHYRVLFLAALVLLMFTFVMNTLAELIRQRLRKKYSSL
ncbi:MULTISPECIES: ABC transporter permease subunit [Pseudomonas]|jgi:phosphate transport system permease protein|uniref:Phosphate transport system permease protein n=2 Tax=Pseudomonas TaxID=286 RepID=A0A9X8EGY4_PSEPU|nr:MULTISPECIES: ABC transporter permease subunit [Pseudomonas]MDN5675629.1 ABC transporter permease subunit [Pseudomonas sp.]KIU51885.1 phosphate ABC transporter permease [Pseudomonas putida]KTC17626.1 phosphate ABC transporter permease [Pseudomonas putida]MBG8558410.1 ABC transporter permease subunit [Pseudomonas qingdaonensis]MCO7505046.1 ABC transporter permease subunit [Pseudomonas sp. VE 267-6A]